MKKLLLLLMLLMVTITGYYVYSNQHSVPEGSSVFVYNVNDTGIKLSGATLQVVNQKDEIIDSWISDGKRHKVVGLQEGFYQLKEIAAPAGYNLNASAILFEVDKDGNIIHQDKKVKVISIVNYNNGFYVSAFSKDGDKELEGATLIIKNSNDTEVIQFTSTNKAHMITGIPEGTYTLSETVPPDGYQLNTGVITFKIDKDGRVLDEEDRVTSKLIVYHEANKDKNE